MAESETRERLRATFYAAKTAVLQRCDRLRHECGKRVCLGSLTNSYIYTSLTTLTLCSCALRRARCGRVSALPTQRALHTLVGAPLLDQIGAGLARRRSPDARSVHTALNRCQAVGAAAGQGCTAGRSLWQDAACLQMARLASQTLARTRPAPVDCQHLCTQRSVHAWLPARRCTAAPVGVHRREALSVPSAWTRGTILRATASE